MTVVPDASQPPDLIGRVRGYRSWELKEDGLLHAIAWGDFAWSEGTVTGHCAESARAFLWQGEEWGDVPHSHDGCGLHAYWLPRATHPTKRTIMGVVESWGGMILYDDTFRAHYSRIVALCVTYGKARRTIAKNYPHIKLYRSMIKMHHDYPPEREVCGVTIPGGMTRFWHMYNPLMTAASLISVAAVLFTAVTLTPSVLSLFPIGMIILLVIVYGRYFL